MTDISLYVECVRHLRYTVSLVSRLERNTHAALTSAVSANIQLSQIQTLDHRVYPAKLLHSQCGAPVASFAVIWDTFLEQPKLKNSLSAYFSSDNFDSENPPLLAFPYRPWPRSRAKRSVLHGVKKDFRNERRRL